MSTALQAAALVTSLLGLASATAVLAATRRGQLSLQVLLEFLLAAGLLRLADDPTPQQLVVAAGVLALRRLLAYDLRRLTAVRAP